MDTLQQIHTAALAGDADAVMIVMTAWCISMMAGIFLVHHALKDD